jgi:hypothetical protein
VRHSWPLPRSQPAPSPGVSDEPNDPTPRALKTASLGCSVVAK